MRVSARVDDFDVDRPSIELALAAEYVQYVWNAILVEISIVVVDD